MHIMSVLENEPETGTTLEALIHKGWSVSKATWHLKCIIRDRHA